MKEFFSRIPRRFFLLTGWTACLIAIVLLANAGAAALQASDNNLSLFPKPNGKLTWRLALLTQQEVALNAQAEARLLHLPASGPGSLMRNESGDIMVYIRVDEISETILNSLAESGATIIHIAGDYNTVTAYVDPTHLQALTAVPAVINVGEEVTPRTSGRAWQEVAALPAFGPDDSTSCPGSIISEGDTQLKANTARSTYGVDGSGVTVGVLSDSFDNANGARNTAAADIASGDLPGPGNPCGKTAAVTVLDEGPDADENIDEGRAMLQIVHDLAPGADLTFATAFRGFFSFADNIRALGSTGADVIVDDVGYANAPMFQDGPVSVAVRDVTENGTTYFSSAGNSHLEDSGGNAISSYEAATYRPTACPTLFLNGAPGSPGKDCHDFNPGGGTDTMMGFTLANEGFIVVDMQWAEPWYGVTTDIDLFIVDSDRNILGLSLDENDVRPFEFTFYQNTTGSTQEVFLVIGRFEGDGIPPLKAVLWQANGVVATEYNATNSTDIFGPTIFGHPGARETMSIAAVPFNDANTPEDFSSQGFLTHYFGPVTSTTPAAALPAPELRQKPDVAATDGTLNTFFGSPDGGGYRFFGTSAAAPHAAAVSALMEHRAVQQGIPLSPSLSANIMKATAAPIANGSPEVTGAGLVNAVTAVARLVPLEEDIYLPLMVR